MGASDTALAFLESFLLAKLPKIARDCYGRANQFPRGSCNRWSRTFKLRTVTPTTSEPQISGIYIAHQQRQERQSSRGLDRPVTVVHILAWQ